MKNLLDQIAHIDEYHINEILNAVLERYGQLYPDWEISTLSIHKDQNRNHQIDRTIELLHHMKQ